LTVARELCTLEHQRAVRAETLIDLICDLGRPRREAIGRPMAME
jgi:hypothetical protein